MVLRLGARRTPLKQCLSDGARGQCPGMEAAVSIYHLSDQSSIPGPGQQGVWGDGSTPVREASVPGPTSALLLTLPVPSPFRASVSMSLKRELDLINDFQLWLHL